MYQADRYNDMKKTFKRKLRRHRMHKKNKDKLLTMPQEEGTQNQSTEELSADMCKL